jgi:TM2 domain-containing membrane protein YozV
MTRSNRNKTLAAAIATLGGFLGLHRFYLHGIKDWVGWLYPLPALLGIQGVLRARNLGLDDQLAWLLIPLLGFTLAAAGLTAVVYALTPKEKWNARHNPAVAPDHRSGWTTPLTIAILVAALMGGSVAFMGSLAFSFQHYFKYQVEAAKALSQVPATAQPSQVK